MAMRQKMLSVNCRYKGILSTDLGALSGLLFEVGQGRRFNASELEHDAELASIEKNIARRHNEILSDQRAESEHAELQAHLLTIGRSLRLRRLHSRERPLPLVGRSITRRVIAAGSAADRCE